MQPQPNPDTSEFAALMDFVATSGRARNHPFVADNADQLVARMWSSRAKAMTLSLATAAKAAMRNDA
jgi:hypothetical protein